jgi:hypothetical protein
MKKKQSNSSTRRAASLREGALLLLALCCLPQTWASTLVSGNVSGVWDQAGSPYIAIDNCTIPSGQSLTIQPGVTVIIGSNLTITASGRISANGTSAHRITIRGAQPSVPWNTISVVHGDGSQSQFMYCDFSDAQTALYLNIVSQNGTMQTTIADCTFHNCTTCVHGYSHGYGYANCQFHVYEPHLNPSITNCRFANSTIGCVFGMDGTQYYDCASGVHYALGYAAPSIANCVFESLHWGVSLQAGSAAGTSYPVIVNALLIANTIGVEAADPYDLNLRNSIFQGCTNAVTRYGSLSSQVGYNCFYGNGQNFVGYPPPYGQIVMVNNRGTPCDVAYNIFQSPVLREMTNYTLSASSPCIDAGDPAPGFADVCSPPSQGTGVNDVGPYGGPNACNWLQVPTILSQPASQSSCLGQTATFSVIAAGAQPLAYQWCFNGAALPGRTSTNLVLTNLQRNQAGQYTVAITNVLGSVTSTPPAELYVYDACIDLRMYAGLNVAGQQGSSYVLSYTTNLNNTNSWVPLATNVMGIAGWFYVDTNSAFSPRRFYKAVLKP